MKLDLIKVVGALSIGALALTGCASDGGGDQPAEAKTAEGADGCNASGKSECKGGKSECKAGKTEAKSE
jgi:hypothetical protein